MNTVIEPGSQKRCQWLEDLDDPSLPCGFVMAITDECDLPPHIMKETWDAIWDRHVDEHADVFYKDLCDSLKLAAYFDQPLC